MESLTDLMTTCVELGATRAMMNLGITAGEITQRKAAKVYGAFFKWAVGCGKLTPCRVGNGASGTRWYKVTDILSLKAESEAKAYLINH